MYRSRQSQAAHIVSGPVGPWAALGAQRPQTLGRTRHPAPSTAPSQPSDLHGVPDLLRLVGGKG